MKTALAIALALTAACQRGEAPPAPALTNTPPTVVPLDAAATPELSLKAHMREHFAAISELQRAIARGHLADAQALASWLAHHDEPVDPTWKPYVDALHGSALAVEQARDLPVAAALAADLGRSCSRCHEATRAVVSFAWEPPPDADATLASQMKRHQWAAARLWDGLVGPAEALWTEGADALATTQLDTAAAAGGVARGDVAALASRIRELATHARATTDHDARAKLYGELLSTCAGCHALVRPQPVPGP